jgi:hypothetical protein
MAERKLAFVIAGTQKGGTVTLDGLFRLHPQIQMAIDKETHFFDDEQRDWSAPDYAALESLYRFEDNRLRGEATPITMYWRPAVQRLHAYNCDIKLILLLRDPVTRAFSNWRKEYSIQKESVLFRDAIREGRARVRAAPLGLHRVFSYVERGHYGEQLEFLLQFFPRESIHCEISEEFFADQAPALRRMADFLGIDAFPEGLPALHLNPGRIFPYPSTLTSDDVVHLRGLYRADIEAVEAFVGRRIEAWRTPIA